MDVERTLAIAAIGTHTEVIGVGTLRVLREQASAVDFLKRLASAGGYVVSSDRLSPAEVAEAQADNRFWVDPQSNLGWALIHLEDNSQTYWHREALRARHELFLLKEKVMKVADEVLITPPRMD